MDDELTNEALPDTDDTNSSVEPDPIPELQLAIELDARVNYALQQNDVPVLKRVKLCNLSDEALDELELRLSAEPDFAAPTSVLLDRLAPGATHEFETFPLKLSPAFLEQVAERVKGVLVFEVWQQDRCLLRHEEALEVLARDEWGGLGSLPQILAAFVLPNLPVIEELLGEAAKILEGWTSNPSLDGYQSGDRERVAKIVAAAYEALRGRELSYVNPPASFESAGQKVRLPERVLTSGMATCLDASLLVAAMLEQAGLHPLIVLQREHAFAGAWLEEASFPDPVVFEGTRLKHRVDLGRALVFDATGVTARPSRTFEQAVREGRRLTEDPDEIVCFLDVHRARLGGVLPLPERASLAASEAAETSASESLPSPDLAAIGVTSAIPASLAEAQDETPETRLDRWRRKLLDLSLRNRLLNFRVSKKTVPLLVHDVAALENALARGGSFRLRARPDELGEGDPRSAGLARERSAEDVVDKLLASELDAGRLCSDLAEQALERHLVEIYRAARTEREEGGVSALFLAVGFLSWYEPGGGQERRAPILLLPLELQRSSVRAGFTLSLADEDARVNVTLIEKLRADYGIEVQGVDPLPEDEAGIDVEAVLQAFRVAITDQDRWDVKGEAAVGFFSFAKFLMWTDLAQRAGSLLENPLVAHLVERPGEAFEPEALFPTPEELDGAHSAAETLCPLPADSSQLAAIWAAAEGRSFVLEGPPGTGKSQTITNLIAHCLGSGKRVLFVSEKMAALDVVRARLESLGLGPFCLELHSNKSQKRHIVQQLGEALDLHAVADEGQREREAEKLEDLREQLNDYVRALHSRRASGESLYVGLSHLIATEAGDHPRITLPTDYDAAGLTQAREHIAGLSLADELSSPVATHAWRAVRRLEFSPALMREVDDLVATLTVATADLETRLAAVSTSLGVVPGELSELQLEALGEVARQLIDAPAAPAGLLVRSDWEELEAEARALIERGRTRDATRSALFTRSEEAILELDLDGLRADWVKADGSFWPLSWFARRAVKKTLAAVTKGGSAPTDAEVPRVLEAALGLVHEERELKARREEARALFGRAWNAGEADWSALEALLAWAEALRLAARSLSGTDFAQAKSLRERWAALVVEGRDELGSKEPLGLLLGEFEAALTHQEAARGAIAECLSLVHERAFGSPGEAGHLERLKAVLAEWRGSSARLREWCGWQRARAHAAEAGLEPLLQLLEDGQLEVSELRACFDRSWYEAWTARLIETEPVLKSFFRQEHERRVTDFRAITERYAELTRDCLRARLAAKVPPPGTRDVANSETGILRREMVKKRRHKSVRTLLRLLPNLVPRLKPCLLMSPLSVAQYLDPEHAPFDVVVFDEASQIPVWDAIGVIARGTQAVIVGDPKQLPPTNFFQRGESEDELDERGAEDELPEDLESILDDCLASGLRTLPLDWHYRSRHESLIAFSNLRYYGGRLVTFPSPDLERDGVSWRYVEDAVYEKGSTRTNPVEAAAIVAEIVERLKDERRAGESLGVVTFNQAQQTLIEDLLEVERRRDSSLDAAFTEGGVESVFVKNLENVQGDERDVILFSITYGPDAAGKVSMNFGPMNREGGERRLNVAVTRARREVIVFSGLRPEHIDLARTNARGVADLKAFLEYADRGAQVTAQDNRLRPIGKAVRGFEETVAEALRERGWQVDEQVGCSEYRIDLGVRDPQRPGRYLLGIECDGTSYASAKTARDRDSSRAGVLRGLGWELLRLWSTDWWFGAEEELERLIARLTELQAAADSAGGGASPEGGGAAPQSRTSTGEHAVPPEPDEGTARLAAAPRAAFVSPPSYSPFPCDEPLGAADDFFEGRSNRKLRATIKRIVAHEGPLSLDLLARRLAALWQLSSVRAGTLERVRELLPEQVISRQSGGTEFLWPGELDPVSWPDYRPASEADESTERAVEDLPLEEIRNAGLAVLRSQIALPIEDLARETARIFGYARLGSSLKARMLLGLEDLFTQALARRDGDSVELV